MQISRSEQKRRIKDIEKLVAEVVALPPRALDDLSLPGELTTLFQETAKLQGGPRQRQIKHLTKLVQEYPLEELYELVGKHRGKALVERKQQHALEFYRDALINEALEKQQGCRETHTEWGENWESDTLADIKAQIPEIDVPSLARLSYLFSRTRNPRYSREIFRSLRAAQELQDRNSRRCGQE